MTTNARTYVSHKDCDHPKTLAARNACRERRRMDDKGKICQTCREHKTFDQFQRDSTLPSGYRHRCKECEQASRWKGRYGITREEYDELLEAQGGGCWICGSEDPGGQGGFHVDHCHGSEVVRGLLCNADNLNTVPGFERLISMGLDPVEVIRTYLARPRIWGKYTENARWSEPQQRWVLKPKFRAEIMAEHDGTCDLCGAEEPEGNGWAVDHDHTTDEIRGVLCNSCNGHVMNGVDRLLDLDVPLSRVLDYLQQDTGIKTTAVAKKRVAYSKSERRQELKRAARRRRYARKRDEKGA